MTLSAMHESRQIKLVVLVAALGYFVDVYDLILFSIVRVASLQDLGLSAEQILPTGVFLLNMQMAGMLVGGVLWGIWGDKKGRVSVLFGSILLYSLANIVNGMVQDVNTYALLRFVAGVGLAGELGAGITLVSEIMSKEKRGLGTTFVATLGVAGAVVAALVAEMTHWRNSYYIGGILGLCLLLLRFAVYESGLFEATLKKSVARGNLLMLFKSRARALRYVSCILIGLPIWYVIGILITFSPEIGSALGMFITPKAGQAILYAYIGLVLGDLASGLISQLLRSRKKVVALFIFQTAVFSWIYLHSKQISLFEFHCVCVLLGFAVGYWAVFVTTAAEQFGTNLRATVTTTTPNFVRGAVVPVTLGFKSLIPTIGVINSALLVGACVILLAVLALSLLRESFHNDLDYLEH